MSAETVLFLLFIGAVGIWVTWLSVIDHIAKKKRMEQRAKKKHLQIVRKIRHEK